MSKLRYVGLDVHKDSIVIAIAETGSRPAEGWGKVESEEQALTALKKLGPLESLRVCYEAGPTGYGLLRRLAAAGVNCVVVAPALVPKIGSRIKTDRRDARQLAHFLRSGDLVTIWVPDVATEAIRDLERSRDDARMAERRIKQQLLKFLLRNSRRFTEGKEHWTRIHWDWIRRQKFESEAQKRVLADAVRTAEQAELRIKRLDEDLAECFPGWRLAPLTRHLQAFRGVQLVTAIGVAAEIGDFQRFATAAKFMGFVGLVPSEHSSGQSRRQGGITKTGNRHVRRLLIEAAWHYIDAPLTVSAALTKRREGVPDSIIAIADKALRRLRKKARALLLRKKSRTKVAAAIARELAGFVWAAAIETAAPQHAVTASPAPLATQKSPARRTRVVAAGAPR